MREDGRWRLAGMMALVYAVQGAFWPLLSIHLQDLGITGRGRGWIFATMALAALVTPLGAGRLADRWMAAERLLAIIYGLGAALLLAAATGAVVGAGPLFVLFLIYWLMTTPALGLSTALALRNLARPREEFGRVRLWGTVGWMAVGWLVAAVMAWAGSSRAGAGAFEAFGVAAALSAFLAVYCLTLPHTPPLAGGRARLDRRGAVEVLRRPAVSTYLLVAFGVSLTTPYAYQVVPADLAARGLGRPWIATAMTLGQVPEIAALAGLPWLLRRVGFRGTLGLGIAAWAVRFASLAADPPLWVALVGILLHGVGTACFSIVGQVFLDDQAPADRRAGAQALNVVVTTGFGALLGNLMAGELAGRLPAGDPRAFLAPCLIDAGLLAAFVVGFRPQRGPSRRDGGPVRLSSPEATARAGPRDSATAGHR